MEKNNLNPIPRLETVSDHEIADTRPSSTIVNRMAWLIFGFNVGFVLILAFVFGISSVVPGFDLRHAESSDQPDTVVVNSDPGVTIIAFQPSPTATILQTPTLKPTIEIAEPTGTPNTKATTRANMRGTQDAALALTPSPTHTPFPSATPIPPTATPVPPPTSYRLDGVSFFRQGWNNCGPANLAMGLSFFNWTGTQEDTANWLKPNREDKNVTPQQMVDYVNKFTNLRAAWRMAGSLEQLQWLVGNNFVVIVESGYEPRGEGWFGHYETVVAYDQNRRTVTVYDSYLGRASRPSIVYGETQFDNNWRTFNRNYIVIYPPNRETELIKYLGGDWYERTNRGRAVQIAQQEASEEPNNPFLWFNLGTSLTSIGRYEEAVVAFERAFNIGLPYRMMWYQFQPYEAYLQTGRFDEVLALANNTLKTTRYVEETYYYRGRAYEMMGDNAAARVEYDNALSFNPNHSQTQAALRRVAMYQ